MNRNVSSRGLRASILVSMNVLVAIWLLASPIALRYAAFPGYLVYVFLGLAIAAGAIARYLRLYRGSLLNLGCLVVAVYIVVASFAPAHVSGQAALNDTIVGMAAVVVSLWNWLDSAARRSPHPAVP